MAMHEMHALVLEYLLWFGYEQLYFPLLQEAKSHLLMVLLPFSAFHKQIMYTIPFQFF